MKCTGITQRLKVDPQICGTTCTRSDKPLEEWRGLVNTTGVRVPPSIHCSLGRKRNLVLHSVMKTILETWMA